MNGLDILLEATENIIELVHKRQGNPLYHQDDLYDLKATLLLVKIQLTNFKRINPSSNVVFHSELYRLMEKLKDVDSKDTFSPFFTHISWLTNEVNFLFNHLNKEHSC